MCADLRRNARAPSSARKSVLPAVPLKRLAREVRRSADDFRKRVRRCRDELDVRSVHNLRIQARRLVVWCELLAALGAGNHALEARRRVKRLLRSLGRLRDLHVQRDLLVGAPKRLAKPARFLRRRLTREEPRRVQRVKDRCRRLHPGRIFDLLDSVFRAGRFARDGSPEVISQGIIDWIASLQAEAGKRLRGARATMPASVHRFRIAVKRLRYGLEAAVELMPALKSGADDLLRDLQVELGNIQDAEVCRLRVEGLSVGSKSGVPRLEGLHTWLTRTRDDHVHHLLSRRTELLAALTVYGIPAALRDLKVSKR